MASKKSEDTAAPELSRNEQTIADRVAAKEGATIQVGETPPPNDVQAYTNPKVD